MRIYTIDSLPKPGNDRKGWPWTEGSPPMPAVSSNGKPWPKISIITPSFNQAQYLEETIRSILLQGYPNLEFFVMDGGSNDGSADILQKYDAFLDGWVSERDKGQSDALNKGLAKCTGEIVNWLCSDDLLQPGAFHRVARQFVEQPEAEVVAGAAAYHFEDGSSPDYIKQCSALDLEYLPAQNPIVQPSCFYRRSLLKREGPLRTDLHYLMDWELWCYFLVQNARWTFVDEVLSVYRVTGTNKGFIGGQKMLKEMYHVYREYSGDVIPLTFWMRNLWQPLNLASRKSESPIIQKFFSYGARAMALMLSGFYPRPRVQGMRKSFTWYDV
jgi:glycosyltransferase involved in cell wall biosynthesis